MLDRRGFAFADPDRIGEERDQRDPAPVPGTTGVTGGVTISPDGAWIVFTSGPQLKKIPRRGGAAITLSDSAGALWKPAWLDDGTIVFPGPGPATLYQVPSGGGHLAQVIGSERDVVGAPELDGGAGLGDRMATQPACKAVNPRQRPPPSASARPARG